MTQDQVLRYLTLVERRLFIIMHSGISWKPEYADELEAIDQELAVLCPLVDQALSQHSK